MFTLDELAQMYRLRDLHVLHGWHFQPKHSPDPPHTLEELVYSRAHGPWLDVLRVRSPTDAQAARVVTDSLYDRLPLITWLTDGTLSDVLGKLSEL
ncbi:MAG: hypothetical protein ABIQ18_05845 [Umezawaea sp.]